MFIYDKSPIELEAYSETKNEFVELNTLNVNIDVDKELCDNLNKIRTGHMNEEEKREITRLCYRYRDIFHTENVPLTFTQAVKHQLRLSNDTPIYVRSYRQAPQQRAEIRNQVDNLLKQVNLDDNEYDELIGRTFENARITQQNDRQTDDEPMAGPSRQDDNLDPDVQLDPQSPSIAESAIDKNQLSEVELVSTNNTQPDNENNGIPILSDAIERQLKQFHIRSTPGTTYRVEDRSTNRRTVIKDVFIPVNNTEQEIIRFLKEHTIADRIFHCYFYNDELYPKFCKVYCTTFNNRGPKLIRCTTRVTLVENKNEQEALIRKYHEEMPKVTKLHSTGKPKALQKSTKPDGSDQRDPEESLREFQLQLLWCIQKLEKSIGEKKGNDRQLQEMWKVLTILKNNNQPIIRKRQLMRKHLGDYRAKMAAEEKSLVKSIVKQDKDSR
ncbi:unnamed protein product [Pieris brassicae]|uniref:Uncharacterized protein n=1 Tax=Pieris brassicae TaxID=7116 RepID=A0A9P0TU05_PIEBR|nr:unnamed protein product [Pieris brassicae]